MKACLVILMVVVLAGCAVKAPAPESQITLATQSIAQAESSGAAGIQGGDEPLHVMPAHPLHWIVVPELVKRRIAAHDLGPLALGDLVFADPEPVQADLVQRIFTIQTTVRPRPAAHHVTAARYPDELHACDGVGPGVAGRRANTPFFLQQQHHHAGKGSTLRFLVARRPGGGKLMLRQGLACHKQTNNKTDENNNRFALDILQYM